MQQPLKRGNQHRLKRRQQRRPSSTKPIVEPPAGPVRLTLHESDPVTGDEDTLYSLFYEDYRGYTIYSTQQGRCCLHSRYGGCLRLRGKFVGFPDIEEAKSFMKRLRAEGYTSYDSVERYVPEWEFVCLNGRDQQQRAPLSSSRPMPRVSSA
jgi:hypothetical protein